MQRTATGGEQGHGTRSVIVARVIVARVIVVSTIVAGVLVPRPAAAYPLASASKSWVKQTFARRLDVPVERVVNLRVFNLEQAPGVAGFALGRHRSKDGKWTYAAVAIYARCGKRFCISHVRLGGANKVRPLMLVDLAAPKTRTPRETRIRVEGGGWLGGRRIDEPPRKARWPMLVVQTERSYEGHRSQQVTLISLKDIKRPTKLLSLRTLSTHKGSYEAKGIGAKGIGAKNIRGKGVRGRGIRGKGVRGRGIRGKGHPRFWGTQVTSVRLVFARGKPPRLVVAKRRITTRFNRCRAPEPEADQYELKGERFEKLPGKGPLRGGCR